MSEEDLLLQTHLRRYPAMRASDAAKLLYQRVFGCGHMVKDFDNCLSRLRDEYQSCAAGESLFEPLGNGYSRLYLGNAREKGIAMWLLARMFFLTAKRNDGTRETFLRETERAKVFFRAEEIDALIAEAIANDFAPFSHSDAYREAYHPAYRVVLSDFERLTPLLNAVYTMRKEKPVTVAIDGRCGAGKTTLAALMSDVFDCPVVQMDDFFLPPALRTAERLATPGGNIDIERFVSEVAPHIGRSEAFSYGMFDCGEQRITRKKAIAASDILIVEGSYSRHPRIDDLYDVKVFCDIDKEAQLARLAARDPERLNAFIERWIPMEEKYFHAFSVKDSADFIL